MIRTIALPTSVVFFFFNDTATTEIYTLSLHDALPISFLNLARASDLRVRRLLLLSRDGMTKHVVAEVLINQRWIVVDPSYRMIMKDANGHFLTRKELQDPAKLDRKSTRLNSSHGYISYA